MNTDWLHSALAIVGLGLITLLTRGFFLLSERPWPTPAWLTEGLRYAPLAALVAVIAPEVVMLDGQLISTWKDARLFAAAAAVACFAWRRSVLATIVVGTSVMVALRMGWGW